MKRSARAENTVQEAARVGEELREARLALGVSVEDAATQLRINKRYLQALEEGRVKDLPGAAYAVGFVRSYATALGLDADDAVRRFRDMSGTAVTKSGELVFPEPVPRRGIPTGILAAIGVAIAVFGYVPGINGAGGESAWSIASPRCRPGWNALLKRPPRVKLPLRRWPNPRHRRRLPLPPRGRPRRRLTPTSRAL